ncbi:MAG: esterase-like activity of phytase family protein [Hyphomicrobium sp.]
MRSVNLDRSWIARFAGPTGGWKRRLGVGVTAVAVAGGIALAEGKPDPRSLKPQSITIEARALAGFDKEKPEQRRFGKLEWVGGLVLTSASPHFGGWSGLALDAAGRRMIAVSDAGTWMTGEIAYSGRRPTGLSSVRIGPLTALDRKVLSKPRDRDAEALALVDGSVEKGNLLISFEGNDRIGRFAIDSSGPQAPSSYLALPPEMKKLRSNDGFEAVAVLRGGPLKGHVLAFAENVLPGQKDLAGWIWTGSGDAKRFSLTDIGGFNITDAAGLPDGSLIVLERRFRWTEGVKMRLRLLRATELKSGAVIGGEVLLEADLNQEIDNMEALAVHAGRNGETVLTVMSDDNFNALLQRSVLLQFILPAGVIAAR